MSAAAPATPQAILSRLARSVVALESDSALAQNRGVDPSGLGCAM